MKRFTLKFTPAFVLIALATATGTSLRAQPQPQPLTKAIAVRSLSVAQAQQNLSVSLRASVTFVEPATVYVQDETAGTFLRFAVAHALQPGDEIEVTGRTRSGFYLPGVSTENVRILRRARMPAPVPASYDDLLSGRFHYQRVAVEGIIRSLAPLEEGRSLLRIARGSRVVEIRVEVAPEREARLVGSRVRVAGLVAGVINDRRQLVQPYLRVSDWNDITVLTPATPDHEVAAISAAALLAFDVAGHGGERLRIGGTVTAAFADGSVFLKDVATAFGVRLTTPAALNVGDAIEVLGFPEMGRVSAMVADAVVIRQRPGTPPTAVEIADISRLRSGHDGSLIAVTGIVSDAFRTDAGVSLVLRSATRTLHTRVPPPGIELPLGALVRLVGICQIDSAKGTPTYNTEIETVSLRARSSGDVTVLRSPSWWTVRRLANVLAVLAAAIVLSGLWITLLRRQVARQTTTLRRRIQSEAALEERHRIAREFHDSLEQELAGLRLRLDALATRAIDDKGREIVSTARSLLARIQIETHNLISDLRDAAENAGDLATALNAIAELHRTTDSGVEVRTDIAPDVPILPESTVHHLRMIARESVNNALKHAGAKQILLQVRAHGAALVMRIVDDGAGFDADTFASGKPGHFGCMGIRERADRIGGTAAWRSAPGRGTTVDVRVPLSANAGQPNVPPPAGSRQPAPSTS